MAFTDRDRVRLYSGLSDSGRVSDELVDQRIADAHADILRDLLPEYTASTDEMLVLAETELSTAYVLRSLALASAYTERDHRSGDLTLRQRGRSAALAARAEVEERRAWGRLLPFLTRSALPHKFVPVEPAEPGDDDWDAEDR